MKIRKFVHSCLLVEEANKRVLIDPGNYSVIDISFLPKLDYLLITHEHTDHMRLPLIKDLLESSPDIKIISNPSVADILGKQGVKVETEGDKNIAVVDVPHEKIFLGSPPQNYLFEVFGKLTHPGDSFQFKLTTPFLALPIQAPWGSTTQAVDLAIKQKPKVIIPIHDWHWNDQAREEMYKRLADFFSTAGILFLGLETGVSKDI